MKSGRHRVVKVAADLEIEAIWKAEDFQNLGRAKLAVTVAGDFPPLY